jgi:hypothetical protein
VHKYTARLVKELNLGIDRFRPEPAALSDDKEMELFIKLMNAVTSSVQIENFKVTGPFLELCSSIIHQSPEPLDSIMPLCIGYLGSINERFDEQSEQDKENSDPTKTNNLPEFNIDFEECLNKLSESSLVEV